MAGDQKWVAREDGTVAVHGAVSCTRTLAEYIAGASSRRYGERIAGLGKQLILDTIGNAISGADTDAGRMTLEYGAEFAGESDEASVVLRSRKLPAKDAAFVNAQLAGLLDLDEAYRNAGHPGSPIVFAALAAGERANADGARLLTAVITAYDVTTRLIDAVSPTLAQWQRGLYPFACTDFFGAAIAAGMVMGLDAEQTYQTLGIAGGNARLPIADKQKEPPMPFMKCSQGWQAEHGIIAAALASKGFTGVHDILDGRVAFWAAAGSDRWAPERLLEGLGDRCNIENMTLKAQPACRLVHAPLEAVLAVIAEHALKPEEIEQIVVYTLTRVVRPVYCDIAPRDMVSAQFSIPFGIALAVLRVPIGPQWYSATIYDDPRVRALAAKIDVRPDPEGEIDRLYAEDTLRAVAKVVVRARGREHRFRTEYAKGDPAKPFTQAETEEKFRTIVKGLVPAERADRIITTVRGLSAATRSEDLGCLLRC